MSDGAPKAVFRDALPLGTVIHGYTICAVLGRGGFGTTYRATDQLDQSFAVKEYFPRQFAMRQGLEVVAGSEQHQANLVDCRQRFLSEANTLCQLGKTAADDGIVKASTGGTSNEALAFAPTRKYGQVDPLALTEWPALSASNSTRGARATLCLRVRRTLSRPLRHSEGPGFRHTAGRDAMSPK